MLRKTGLLWLVLCEMSIAQEVAFPPLFPLEEYEAATIAAGELMALEKGFPNLEALAPQCVDATVAAMAAADAEARSRGLRGTRWRTNGKVEEVWEAWGDRVVTACKQASTEKLIVESQEWRVRPVPPWKAVWHAVLIPLGNAEDRERVLAELDLGEQQSRALFDFAREVVLSGTPIHARFAKELVCDRRATFETTAAIGKAFDRAEALRVAEEEQLFRGIERVLSTENLEQVFRYSVERQSVLREVDNEAWYGNLGAEIVESLVDRRCWLVRATLEGSAGPQVPLVDSPRGGRRQRR